MCPFLEEEDDFDDYQNDNSTHSSRSFENKDFKYKFLKDDRRFFIVGGAAAIVAFCAVMYIMYSNNKPIDLEDLPVIKADTAPLKVKPENNMLVDHQDKIVYDNISDTKRSNVEEKTVPQTEEVLSINEIDSNGVLSDDEKKKIIQAFDDLAPEKEYKINYVKTGSATKSTTKEKIKIVEDEALPPLKRVEDKPRNNIPTKKIKTKNLIANARQSVTTPTQTGSVMIQVASVPTKSAAEAEYKRIIGRNKILKKTGKKIVKVDLGKPKGIVYRVQVGPFKNNAEAKKVVSSLKKNGFFSYISR